MMKGVRLALAISIAWAAVGCGGNTPLTYNPAPLYYRGKLTLLSNAAGVGTAPIAASVIPGVGFTAFAYTPPISATITKRNPTDRVTAVLNETVVNGPIQEVDGPNSLSFTILSGHTEVATVSMTRQSPPSLGSAILIPPTLTVTGEQLFFGAQGLTGLGTASAQVLSNGSFAVSAAPDNYDFYIYTGQFNADGTISNPTLVEDGGVTIPWGTSRYSFDGKTLIIRWGDPSQGPYITWLTFGVSG